MVRGISVLGRKSKLLYSQNMVIHIHEIFLDSRNIAAVFLLRQPLRTGRGLNPRFLMTNTAQIGHVRYDIA